MAGQDPLPQGNDDEAVPAESAAGADLAEMPTGWSGLWQVPTILASLLLITLGIVVAMNRAPANDFHAALDQVDRLISMGELAVARDRMQTGIQPFLHEATELQLGRFHATSADLIHETQMAAGARSRDNDSLIDEQYRSATTLGFQLGPARLERWAGAAISLGDFDTARNRLAELEAMSLSADADPQTRHRRNRILRRIVEENLRFPDLDFEHLMALLEDYRRDDLLRPEDDLWAVTRQAELRLEQRLFDEAVDHLLLASRRIENRAGGDLNFAEVYTLLGRGYYHLGENAKAVHALERALNLYEGPEAPRGDALLVLGLIHVARDEVDDALERFDEVLRNYRGTNAWMPSLLGRAEILGVLGEHDRSLADYRELRQVLRDQGPRRDLPVDRIGQSLVDRHQAAITARDMPLALRYLKVAETFWPADRVPEQILWYLAWTCRQIAETMIADAAVAGPMGEVDPAVRYEANGFYRQAGEYAVRHVRAIAGVPDKDEAWASSLFLAADSFDLGGEHAESAEHFREFVDGQAQSPQLPEALYRLGSAHAALHEHDLAIEAWERLIDQHDRSREAHEAYVPLARSLLELDRAPEAERLLVSVLNGNTPLEPAAPEYQAALIELGTILHDRDDHVAAIERLHEAAERYPDHPRRAEVEFRLADSYRSRALEAHDLLGAGDLISNADEQRLKDQRAASFASARERFASVIRRMRSIKSHMRDRLQEDMLRHSHLYEADCAFYLGDYVEAIELYETFVRKYSDHHASMTAQIQIVNCYDAMGDEDQARSAHNAARVRLQQLPEKAFASPDALMSRAAWERWLDNSPLGSS